MKEVPKKDVPEVSGGIQVHDGFRNGLGIPGMPAPGYPNEPCIPLSPDPTVIAPEK